MDWELIRAKGSIRVKGTEYALGHLQDVIYPVVIEATDKHPRVDAELLVRYSSHCCTEGPPRDTQFDFSVIGEDHRVIDHHGHHRCFDGTRFQHSLNLPGIFEGFIDRTCYFTGRDNWLTVEIPAAGGAVRQEYQIYFTITRKSPKFALLYVSSAYVDNVPAAMPSSRRDVVKAKTLVAKTLRGERINRPQRR